MPLPQRRLGSCSCKCSPCRLHGIGNYLIRFVILAVGGEISEHVSDLSSVPSQVAAAPCSGRDTSKVITIEGAMERGKMVCCLECRFPEDDLGNQPVEAFIGCLTGPAENIHNLRTMRAAGQSCDLVDSPPAVNSARLEEVEDRFNYIFGKGQLRSAGSDEIARFVL